MSAVSEFRLRNQLAELERLGEEVRLFATAQQLPPSLAQAFDISLAEWVTNIISYGYPDAGEHWIQVRLSLIGDVVRAEVVDEGRVFNPLTHPPVDTSAPLESRPIGGLGIHMMRKLMDGVEYRREGAKNIVTLTSRRAV